MEHIEEALVAVGALAGGIAKPSVTAAKALRSEAGWPITGYAIAQVGLEGKRQTLLIFDICSDASEYP